MNVVESRGGIDAEQVKMQRKMRKTARGARSAEVRPCRCCRCGSRSTIIANYLGSRTTRSVCLWVPPGWTRVDMDTARIAAIVFSGRNDGDLLCLRCRESLQAWFVS